MERTEGRGEGHVSREREREREEFNSAVRGGLEVNIELERVETPGVCGEGLVYSARGW